jgi:hypothetical protein
MWYLSPVLFHKETGLLTPLFGEEISLGIASLLTFYGWCIAFFLILVASYVLSRLGRQ